MIGDRREKGQLQDSAARTQGTKAEGGLRWGPEEGGLKHPTKRKESRCVLTSVDGQLRWAPMKPSSDSFSCPCGISTLSSVGGSTGVLEERGKGMI